MTLFRRSVKLFNVVDGEHIHQRCLLINGRICDRPARDSFITVTTRDEHGALLFPTQTWPVNAGDFKALVILAPGSNHLEVMLEDIKEMTAKVTLHYTPLLQVPPLHLAILVAKDSPLQIDCPPGKHGGISSTHSSLEAAIAKFRMTAYMWQAMTAEDMRVKGLGRRAFRLEEEWACDTLSKEQLDASNSSSTFKAMNSTAKVHLVRTSKTVAQLRDADLAQQNPNARTKDELHAIFSQALDEHGGVFEASARPVVAGLILDSHFSMDKSLVLAHAALGSHNPNGLSLGIMGSHLTYAWPRFMEEAVSCLSDERSPGSQVCNDNGECTTMWEACSVGQGAFLHEVGHAFSAPHTTGIMARGYSPDWPKCFLSHVEHSRRLKRQSTSPTTDMSLNNATWDLSDALRFRHMPHFRLPLDMRLDSEVLKSQPKIDLVESDYEDSTMLKITSAIGIARIWLNEDAEPESVASVSKPASILQFTLGELEMRFDRKNPLELKLLSMNGKPTTYNLWTLFNSPGTIRVPGSSIRLYKQSVGSPWDEDNAKNEWKWAVMLKKRSTSGELIRASKIDIRVGCSLDGAVVYYKDGSKIPCGPRYDTNGNDIGMGGHQARKMALPLGVDIAKVAVCTYGDCSSGSLAGLRFWLDNGKAMGALNRSEGTTVKDLVPPPGQRIIGFYGSSGRWSMCHEFGIITAYKDAKLPDSMYDMEELQNTDGGTEVPAKRRKLKHGEDTVQANDVSTSEDEDTGYDHDVDSETE